MAFGRERRKRARSEQNAGHVSRQAQQRVDKRVIEIMLRRDARRDSDRRRATETGSEEPRP